MLFPELKDGQAETLAMAETVSTLSSPACGRAGQGDLAESHIPTNASTHRPLLRMLPHAAMHRRSIGWIEYPGQTED
jgi:hypothetical protein